MILSNQDTLSWTNFSNFGIYEGFVLFHLFRRFNPKFYVCLFLDCHVSCEFISLFDPKIIVSTYQTSRLGSWSWVWKLWSNDYFTQFINSKGFIEHNSSLSIKSSSKCISLFIIDLQLSNCIWFFSLKVLLKLYLLSSNFFLCFSFLSPCSFFANSFSISS